MKQECKEEGYKCKDCLDFNCNENPLLKLEIEIEEEKLERERIQAGYKE